MADPHTDHNSDYVKGEMDIHEQASSYALFGKMSKWGGLTTAVLLLFLTVWFAAGAGFFAAALTAIVTAVIGFFLLKSKPEAH